MTLMYVIYDVRYLFSGSLCNILSNIRPPKHQISDITCSPKNQISGLENQISDITPKTEGAAREAAYS